MPPLLAKFQSLLPDIRFEAGSSCFWSPQANIIQYRADNRLTSRWGLCHEVAHALLDHQGYRYDFNLLRLEVAAWQTAAQLAEIHCQAIDADYLQDCLDSYRDWLHQRSTCPSCSLVGLQISPFTYHCYNCFSQWSVSQARFCRAYRRRGSRPNKKSPGVNQAIFV